jgi:NAD(P)H dehydrogenase (quinone)
MAPSLKVAALAARKGMVCISKLIPGGYKSSASDFAAAHNRAGHLLGLGIKALTDQPADQIQDRYNLETADMFAKRVGQAALRLVRLPAQPERA